VSKAPEHCLYCKGDDPNCGFCEMGKPLDTQEDWDNSWGRVEKLIHDFVVPRMVQPGDFTEADNVVPDSQ
jgi:hypothetical protein